MEGRRVSGEHVDLYRDHATPPRWRWTVRAGNNRVIGDSGQGYRRKFWAKLMARRAYPGAPIREVVR
jgi:hypothetical protein